MRKKTILSLALAFATLLHGGVPVRWTAETSRVQPVSLDAFRGDTLDLECTLKSYGQPVSLGAATASLMWQTNGMGSAWWQTNATVSAGGVVRATWSPSMDPGAATVAFFLPVQTADGASYRAAGAIRFRPSPGADSQIVELPQPGGTLDFGSYQLVNAPWATLEAANAAIEAAVTSATGALVIPPPVDLGPYATTGYVAGAITSATGALVIPPPPDLTPYATTGLVAEAVQAAGNALAAQINAVSNAAMQRAEMGGYATLQQVADAIAGIAIPSLVGYATQQWTADYVATNTPAINLEPYATRDYADAAASNAQAAAEAQIPSLAGYATQEYVADYVASNTPSINLAPYATKDYADAAASNAQAAAEAQIPSLAGYATQEWTADYVASNTPSVNMEPYATRDYADAVASNAQAAAEARIPSLAGYATQEWTADYVASNTPSVNLGPYATRDYADAVASNAQAAAEAQIPSLEGYATQQDVVDYFDARFAQGVVVEAETTRLATLDGLVWQDATGVVWQVEIVSGWVGTVWTNSQDYSAASTGYTFQVVFAPAGTNQQGQATYTNDTWGSVSFGPMGWCWTLDGPDGPAYLYNEVGIGDTNVFVLGTTAYATNGLCSANLAFGPIGTASTNAVRQVVYTDGPGPDAPSSSPADILTDGTNTIYASRDVYRSVATNYYTDWTWTISPQTNAAFTIYWGPDSPDAEVAELTAQWYCDAYIGSGGPYNALGGDLTSTNLVLVSDFGTSTNFMVTFTRDQVSTNANQFVGILALTNNIAEAISTNNAAFVAAVTNCPVVIAAADGITLGDFGEYGTLGSLLAALAAAITWLKANKANKTDLPYPFVGATVTQERPRLPASAFPIAGSYDGTPFSFSASEVSIAPNTTTGELMVLSDNLGFVVCVYTSAGAYSAAGTNITNLTFGGSSTPPSMEFPNVLTVSPRTVATYTADSSAAAFTVAVGTGVADRNRDCVLVVDCTGAGAVAPTVTWPSNFHPRGDAEEIAPVAGVRNVFYISEYAPGEFVVGGWHEEVGT